MCSNWDNVSKELPLSSLSYMNISWIYHEYLQTIRLFLIQINSLEPEKCWSLPQNPINLWQFDLDLDLSFTIRHNSCQLDLDLDLHLDLSKTQLTPAWAGTRPGPELDNKTHLPPAWSLLCLWSWRRSRDPVSASVLSFRWHKRGQSQRQKIPRHFLKC